jgi:hypothetical protein
VDNAVLVGVSHRTGDPGNHLGPLARTGLPGAEPLSERAAFDEGHGDVGVVAELPDLKNWADVGVSQLGRSPGFA